MSLDLDRRNECSGHANTCISRGDEGNDLFDTKMGAGNAILSADGDERDGPVGAGVANFARYRSYHHAFRETNSFAFTRDTVSIGSATMGR